MKGIMRTNNQKEEEKNMFSLMDGLAGVLLKVGKIILAVIIIFYALLLVTAW